jgi:hypothetical protein
VAWMILVGIGAYAGYVPYNCVLFDRMTAALAIPGNAAFAIYLADSSGYAGSVALLLYKNLGAPELSWLAFFEGAVLISSVLIAAFASLAAVSFMARAPGRAAAATG